MGQHDGRDEVNLVGDAPENLSASGTEGTEGTEE